VDGVRAVYCAATLNVISVSHVYPGDFKYANVVCYERLIAGGVVRLAVFVIDGRLKKPSVLSVEQLHRTGGSMIR